MKYLKNRPAFDEPNRIYFQQVIEELDQYPANVSYK